MELLFGQMEVNIKENLKITIFKALVIMCGWMEDNLKVLGEIIKCMEEGFLFGQMVVNMKGNI